MESLKVGFFCWESMYAERVGGLACAATNLAETLAKNHEVHYFTGGGCRIRPSITSRTITAGLRVVIPCSTCEDMSNKMVDQFHQFDKQEKFDILHFHDWHPIPALHRLRTGIPSSRSIPRNMAEMVTSMVTGGSIRRSPARSGTGGYRKAGDCGFHGHEK